VGRILNGLVVGVLVGCHSVGDVFDGGSFAAVGDASPDTTVDGDASIADASDVSATVTLRDLDGGTPPHARFGKVLLCSWHSVWNPPEDFAVVQVGRDFIARKGDRVVGLALVPPSDDAHVDLAERIVTGDLTWDAPVMKVIDAWHAEGTFHGAASGLAMAVQIAYPGIDSATGKPRNGGKRSAWLAVAPTRVEADTLLADARQHTLSLVDHACECGYDCEQRRPPSR
jgi:hypothetical protein